MKVLVCGSRDYSDRDYLFAFLDELASVVKVDCIIEGEQRGADVLAREWAEARDVALEPYAAEWDRYRPPPGRKNPAGAIRNGRMLNEGKPDLIVAFPLPQSSGTWDMVRQGREARVTTWIMPQDRYIVTAIGEGVFA